MTGTEATSQDPQAVPASFEDLPLVETDLLIVGAGPAGASLACFLASYGLTGIIISNSPSTADTPRAHLMNSAALECLRDIDLEDECRKLASPREDLQHTRWCHSMAGEEYARIYSWGFDPKRKGEYEMASPCSRFDCPQTLAEPILVKYATLRGFKMRFSTEFISHVDDEKAGVVTSLVRDMVTNQKYRVKSKYLFGADGARGEVLRQLGIGLIKEPGQGLAINVLVKTDLSHLMPNRMGNLHWILQPDVKHPDWGWAGIVRMVKPWKEWLFILFPSPGAGTDFSPTREQYLGRIKEFIGDDTPAEILGVSKWYINETVAEKYSKGNVFCLGDAVHRHPPMNALGSNTCIQDAFNLAWKIAYVMKGKASKSILASYNIERQPVGQIVITRANQALRDHIAVWTSLGVLNPTPETRMAAFSELSASTPEGATRREALRAAVAGTSREFHALGVEMNQRYPASSNAVHTADSDVASPHPSCVPVSGGKLTDDQIHTYIPNTNPGSRLPHFWLLPAPTRAVPVAPLVSSIDIAGHGVFTLFTGILGRETWAVAASSVSESLRVDIRPVCVGFRADFEDPYATWRELCQDEIGEDGCVLVRPDRFVGWRARGSEDRTARLMSAMSAILGREQQS